MGNRISTTPALPVNPLTEPQPMTEPSPVQAMSDDLRHKLASADQRYRALQVSIGFLSAIAEQHNLDEDATRGKLWHNGELIGEFTLGQVLDMADAALEPDDSGKQED